jgi:ASC-1-like (ASCH) protein
MIHTFKLQPEPFNKIAQGTKIIELRLFDEKRQTIQINDTIEFLKEPEQMEKVHTQVTALLRYPTFSDLIMDFPVEYFGGKERDQLIKDVHKFYTVENETQFGVVGIKIKLI